MKTQTITWHPYPQETPTKEGEYLVSIRYNAHSAVRLVQYSERFGIVFDESGEDYWVSKDISNGDAHINAWSEIPRPYEG